MFEQVTLFINWYLIGFVTRVNNFNPSNFYSLTQIRENIVWTLDILYDTYYTLLSYPESRDPIYWTLGLFVIIYFMNYVWKKCKRMVFSHNINYENRVQAIDDMRNNILENQLIGLSLEQGRKLANKYSYRIATNELWCTASRGPYIIVNTKNNKIMSIVKYIA